MEEKKVKEITEEQSEKKAKKSKKGFTLIELIVCVTLLGVLMALIIPGLMKQVGAARENTAMTQCMSCVSAAEMNTVMDEAWETIDEPEVPLAALPRTTTAKKADAEAQAEAVSWKEIEAQAGAKGTIIFMETAAGRVSKLVYVTENGR